MAIVALGLTDPGADSHFVLCPLRLLRITWCPGCGIGHAISWLLHGNLNQSVKAHWFGIPALLIILYRIYDLIYLRINHLKQLKTF